jgi:hypothetical protein
LASFVSLFGILTPLSPRDSEGATDPLRAVLRPCPMWSQRSGGYGQYAERLALRARV